MSVADLGHNDVSLDVIAGGHDIDHPSFDTVVSPHFEAAMQRLVCAADGKRQPILCMLVWPARNDSNVRPSDS